MQLCHTLDNDMHLGVKMAQWCHWIQEQNSWVYYCFSAMCVRSCFLEMSFDLTLEHGCRAMCCAVCSILVLSVLLPYQVCILQYTSISVWQLAIQQFM